MSLPSGRQVFRARYLATLSTDLIEDGCVIVDAGKITSFGRYAELKPAQVTHNIDGLLMPGLVNRHTHLELSNLSPPSIKPETFQDWILWLGTQVRRDLDDVENRIASALQQGIDQCLQFGVTEAWDISQHAIISRKILSQSVLRCTSFGECLGIGERRDRFEKLLHIAADSSFNTDLLSIGISPHAPYTVDESGYAKVFDIAADRDLPVMTHLAELEDESRFLLNHSGSFGGLYALLGINPGEAPGFAGSPVEWIRGIKPDSQPVWLAHVNYASDDDLLHLSRMNARVIYCPRTHVYFQHPPHRWKEMLRAGIEVYLGTDSCASSPNLNLLDELRLVHPEAKDLSFNQLYQLISKPLQIGFPADLISFDTKTKEPLQEIIEDQSQLPQSIWINGDAV